MEAIDDEHISAERGLAFEIIAYGQTRNGCAKQSLEGG